MFKISARIRRSSWSNVASTGEIQHGAVLRIYRILKIVINCLSDL